MAIKKKVVSSHPKRILPSNAFFSLTHPERPTVFITGTDNPT